MTAAVANPDPGEAPSVDELVRSHMPLVGHLVRELLSRVPAHVNRDDLVSAGMFALVLSAKSFEPARGVPFGRFAAIRIRGALTDELRGMDWASRAVRTKARDIESTRNQLAATLGRVPTRVELAQLMGVKVQELDAVESDVHRAAVLSLQGLSQDDGAELLPTSNDGPEHVLIKREQFGYLRDAVAELPDRLRMVVEQCFFAQRKMLDIAGELGVTESRVSQLRSEALALLRLGMRGHGDITEPNARRTGSGRPHAGREAYCAAVAARSTLAGRLQATTVLGEVLAGPRLGCDATAS
ncbi:MAG: polymerase sigma factor FliA [Pseudonocardiales bacterium]|nr:polymerase sigma factor FliA [Pseudonocardiales bacterium]MDT4944140.1 polymerase sigma factor FliA [Pseudonocardiales bacterium]